MNYKFKRKKYNNI